LYKYSEFLRDQDVVILPDNDPQTTDKTGKLLFHPDGRPRFAGQDHAQDIARNLHGIAKRVRVLMLPGLKLKGDVINWLEAGGTKDQLLELAQQQTAWKAEQQEPEYKVTPFTEEALALLFAERHAHELRFVAAWGKWFRWNGHKWEDEKTLRAFDLA